MKKNVGRTDGYLRFFVAAALVGLIVEGAASGVWAWVAGAGAAIMAVTSVVNFCPIYALFGINTCPAKR